MEPLNVGSLFSGIGGFDLGLERAGMRVSWQCEQDDFCRRVLSRHWPDVPCYPDITELAGTDVAPVDVLCGGFPCQDISLAGLGAGIGGKRSGLWGEYARLIRELRPRYVVVENVSALLARGLDVVLADLASCGYDAEWDCIPASAVGAPHRRDRVWLVAYPNSEGEPGSAVNAEQGRRLVVQGGNLADTESSGGGLEGGEPLRQGWRATESRGEGVLEGRSASHVGASAGGGSEASVAHAEGEPIGAGLRTDEPGGIGRGRPRDSGSADVQDADSSALQPWRVGGRAAQTGGAEWWAVEPPVGRVAHGVPDRLVQLAALGNALVPQIAEWLGRRILEWEGGIAHG